MSGMKKMLNRIIAAAVSAAIIIQSPAFVNAAYAEPAEEGTEAAVSENGTGSGNEAIPPDGVEPAKGEASGNEAEHLEEPENGSGEDTGSEILTENTGVSVNSVSEDATVSENSVSTDGQAVVGGYIEMPWDNDTPVAPADLDYREAVKRIVEETQEGEEPAGYVVEPVTIESKFPAGTDSEVLAYLKNKYPATRSQSPYGTCWAHSTIALSEFYMISHGLKDGSGTVDKDVDYSELALAYFCYNQAPDPVNGSTGDTIVFDPTKGERKSFLDFGGNLSFSSQSLMRYNGVTNDEEDAAYSNAGNVLSGGMDPSYARENDTAHLKNVYHINIKENAKLVKQAIKENGIVGVSIYADDAYMNTAHNAFYNNVNDKTNHAVAVVGWNDDFPKGYFKTQPANNGAWLVRNSWTTTTAYSYYSYFWLSYEDKSLADTAYVFEMADKDSGEYYDNNYNYDSQLHSVTTADSTTVANVFTAVKNSESLKAVQIDSTINIPGSYTVSVYKNLSNSSNPESGILAATASGEFPFAGKFTVPFTEPVELSEGEVFSVVVTAEKRIDQERDFTWNEQIVMDTEIHEGESFAKTNGIWKDVVNNTNGGMYGNLCIRALTNTKGGTSLPEQIKSLSVRNRTEQSISLQWSAAKDAEGYEVWYSNAENGAYSKAGETSATERKYKHSGLSAGTVYFYKVYPVKNGSRYEAGLSPVVSASTISATPQVEVINIGNYTATARWDKLENCDGYLYKYSLGNTYYGWYATTNNEVKLKYLTPGQTHRLVVMSYTGDPNNNPDTSEECSVEFTTQSGSGSAVTNLKAEPYSSRSVRLTWDEQAELGYQTIERSTDGVNFTELGSYNPITTYYDNGLDSNTKYYYRITSVFYKFGGDNKDSYTSAIVSSYTKLPASDVNDVDVEGGGIKISWTAVTGANYYSIYRREQSASEYIPLTILPASETLQYTDTTPLPGRLYYYRVYGCRTNELTDSQGVTGYGYGTSVQLDKVTDLAVSNIGSSTATLSWSPIRGAQGYIIKKHNGSEFEEVDRVDSEYTSYTISGLLPNTTYQYVVGAFTDYAYGGGTGKYFTTKSGESAQASFFSVAADDCAYDGAGHGATVTCSVEEIASAGYTVSYGKVVNGAVSSYSTAKPVNAGTYSIKIKTNATLHYLSTELTDPEWSFTISPKSIMPSVTLSPSGYSYTGNECRPAVTVKDGGTVLVKGTDYDISYSNNINVGTATVTVTSKTGSNYTFTEKTETFTIGKGTTAVTVAGGNRTVTYGAGNILLSASASVPGTGVKTWTWSSGDDSVAMVDASGEVTIVGQGTAVITAAYSSNDTEGSGSITITVNKASLTVRANDNTITYGDAPAANGVTYSGFVYGDDESVLTGTLEYAYDYSRYGQTGSSYEITPSGLSATNYAITYVPGRLTVVSKEIGLNWSGTSLTYNGEAQKPIAAATGLVNGDSCAVTVTGEKTDAGTYTAAASAVSNPNYRLPSIKTVSFTIAKVSYGDKTASGSARYGNTGQVDLSVYIAPGGSLKTSGIIKSDTYNVLSAEPSVTGSSLNFGFTDNVSNVGKTATVTVGVSGGLNYEDHTITVTLTVLDKTPQNVVFNGVTGGSVNKTYGDADFTMTAEANGTITYSSSDENVASVTTGGKVHIKKAGQTTIMASAAATGSYAAGSASYVLTVGKKEIGISWTSTLFTYDRTGKKPVAEATGLKRGDTCTLTVTGEQVNAGTYTATVTALDNDSYKLPSTVSRSFTINKREVSVSGITASDKVYDGTVAAELDQSQAAFDGKIGEDTLTVLATGTFADADAGTGKKVSVSVKALGGADVANYELASSGNQTEAEASIAQRPVTVKAKDQTVPLKGTIVNNASMAELTGAVSGHSLYGVSLTGSSTENVTDSGTITPSSAVIKDGNRVVTGNYNISYETGKLTVTKAAPQVTAPSAKDLTFNTQAQKLVNAGVSSEGTVMKYSLAENGTYGTEIPEGTSAGDYTVWYMVEGGTNYSDTEPAKVTVNIKKAPLSNASVTLGSALTYSGTVQTQTVSKVTVGGYKLDASEYTVTDNTALNAGSYELTVTAVSDKNCTGSIKKKFTVAKKNIIPVVTVSGSYIYTGKPIEPVFTVMVGDDELALTDYDFELKNNINAGEGKIIITETTGGNYSFETKELDFRINKAEHADVELSSSAMYGTSQTLDLSGTKESGASFGDISVTDTYDLLNGNPVLNGNVLSYGFGGTADDVGKTVTVTVPVTGADNYNDYNVVITLTVINCAHNDLEIKGAKIPTCTEKGYSGDKVCKDCGNVIEYGHEIDIDPNNHLYDGGKVTEVPTLFKAGVKTFTCLRCGHTYTESIPKLEGSGDMEEIMKDTEDLSGNAAPSISIGTDEKGNETESFKVGGEEVSKTVTDKESGTQTVETKVWIAGISESYCYTGAAIKPTFHVYDGTVLLKENTDYSVSYKNNKNAGQADITVKFKGNYKNTGNKTTHFTIAPAVLGKDVIAGEIGLAAKKGAQKVVPVLTSAATGKAVSARSFACEPETVEQPGEYDVVVRSNDPNYTGQTTIKVRVVGDRNRLLSGAKVIFSPASYQYTGNEIRPAKGSYTLKIGTNILTEGNDYVVTGIFNNTDPGSASMVFEALSGNEAGYVGTKTATFKITGKKELKADGGDFSFICPESVPYSKGGARPQITVKDNGRTLKEGTDYTLSFKGNNVLTTNKKAEVTIKGKGMYKGSVPLYFNVTKQNIEAISGNVATSDQFVIRSKLKTPGVAITDLDGKKLNLKKDFAIAKIDDSDPDNTDKEGIIKLVIAGIGCYEGTCEASFRYMESSRDIKKARQSAKIADQAYTGRNIELGKDQLAGILIAGGKTLYPGTDFVVEGYQNNIKKGNAKVTLRGIGSYGGTKVLAFKIVQKDVDYRGALIGGQWT